MLHQGELKLNEEEAEKQIDKVYKELESSNETSEKPQEVSTSTSKESPSEDDKKTYEEKTKEVWTKNPKTPETRLSYTDKEIEIIEEDL